MNDDIHRQYFRAIACTQSRAFRGYMDDIARTLLEQTREGVLAVSHDHQVLYRNSAFDRACGISLPHDETDLILVLDELEKSISKTAFTRVHSLLNQDPETPDKITSSGIDPVTLADGSAYHLSIGPLNGSSHGTVLWISPATDSKPMSGLEGKVGKQLDLNESATAESMPSGSLEAAERTARYASIGALVAAINHEMNQPLNALRLGAEGILLWSDANPHLLPDFVRGNLVAMREAVDRIAATVDNLHRYGKYDVEQKQEVVGLNQLVKAALGLTGGRLQNHKIVVELDLDSRNPVVRVRRLHVEQMINNLLMNAMTVLDKSNSRDKLIVMHTFEEGDKAGITIEDNGPGLPDDPDTMFDLLSNQGISQLDTWFGLPIVATLAKRESANVTAAASELGGSAFTLTFPIAKSNA